MRSRHPARIPFGPRKMVVTSQGFPWGAGFVIGVCDFESAGIGSIGINGSLRHRRIAHVPACGRVRTRGLGTYAETGGCGSEFSMERGKWKDPKAGCRVLGIGCSEAAGRRAGICGKFAIDLGRG